MSDTVILALRLTQGLSLVEFERRFGVTVEKQYGRQIDELRELGLAEVEDRFLRLTDRGRLIGNEASLRFLP
jgi:oxygen-independent coproporphyrinogen-3 oxidase